MHLNPAWLPPRDRPLDWLSIMQHYGGPTRLLDFTYSPYVALYFAIRRRRKDIADHAEVWGIDAVALRARAEATSGKADEKTRKGDQPERPRKRFSWHPDNTASSLQQTQEADERWDRRVQDVLRPGGVRRNYYNANGFIAATVPPTHNPRLAAQQGLFLLNGAEDKTFELSLEDMMSGVDTVWFGRYRIPPEIIHEVEERLFQMNIHELSLFPDAQGLAGFVTQQVRLHW